MIDANFRRTRLGELMRGGESAPSADFRTNVLLALIAHGIHVTPDRIDPSELDALVQMGWDDPTIKADWESGNFDTNYDGYRSGLPSFKTYLTRALFADPTSGLFTTGIALKQAQGLSLTAAERKAAGPMVAPVPAPFDPKFYSISGYHFGQVTGDPLEPIHQGVDYGLPNGTPLYALGSGTIEFAGDGGAYGNMVKLRLDNGYEVLMGHLSSLSVVAGQHVNPGEPLGESGSTGHSTGAHLHFELRDAQGNPVDPASILDRVYQEGGSTYADLNWSNVAGTGLSPTDARNRLLGIDPILNAKYPGAVSLWETYFGKTPTAQQVLQVGLAGNARQQEDYIRSLSSQIPGMNLGQYHDLRGIADGVSKAMFGHLATDGIVKELFDQRKLSQTAAEFWYSQWDIAHKGLDPATYNTIYAANQPHMAAIYNEPNGFDPRMAYQQFTASGGAQATPTQAVAASDGLPAAAGPSVDESPNAGKPYVGPPGEYSNIPLARQRVNRSGGVLVE